MKSFKSYYEQLCGSRRRNFKRLVMQRTGWSNSTFYYKREHGNITRLEYEAIYDIINLLKREIRAEQRFVDNYYRAK